VWLSFDSLLAPSIHCLSDLSAHLFRVAGIVQVHTASPQARRRATRGPVSRQAIRRDQARQFGFDSRLQRGALMARQVDPIKYQPLNVQMNM
jgi:hypothetical protein